MENNRDRDAKEEIRRSDEQLNSTYDAEHEIPDPKQVERDRQRAEQEFDEQRKKAS